MGPSPFMPHYVFRTVKHIIPETNLFQAPAVSGALTPVPYILDANEYVFEIQDDTPEILDFIASVLVAAEACLMLKTRWLFVAIWPLEIGQKITPETPLKVCFRTDMTVYTDDAQFYPITRYQKMSDNWYQSSVAQRLKPLLLKREDVADSNPYNRPSAVDPFIGVTISRNCVAGRNRKMVYKNCLDESDYFWDADGVLTLVSGSNFLNCRFADYENTMRVLYPIVSNCYLDKDGFLREGEFVYTQLFVSCATDLKAARRAYRTSIGFRYRMAAMIDSSVTLCGFYFRAAEQLATQEKDLLILTGRNRYEKPAYYYVLGNFSTMFRTFYNNIYLYGKGGTAPGFVTTQNNWAATTSPVQAPISPEFDTYAAQIAQYCLDFTQFAEGKPRQPARTMESGIYSTSPHAPIEAQPAGANFVFPQNFDVDKWIKDTAAMADDIYNNWEATFRVLEIGIGIVAVMEKFLAHQKSTTRAKVPRWYARAQATTETRTGPAIAPLLLPTRANNGLSDPLTFSPNTRQNIKYVRPRVYDPTPLACPARAAFWMPRLKSYTLDRSGYDARLRTYLSASDRKRIFTAPAAQVPQGNDAPRGGGNDAPRNTDISDRTRNCPDLRIKLNVDTLWGGHYDFSFTVPHTVLVGAKQIISGGAYRTSDCLQLKPPSFTLPANPFAGLKVG